MERLELYFTANVEDTVRRQWVSFLSACGDRNKNLLALLKSRDRQTDDGVLSPNANASNNGTFPVKLLFPYAQSCWPHLCQK